MIASEAEHLFLTALDEIERTIRFACARASLSGADAEDFASIVKLRLIEDDYSILRKYESRSSLQMFINVVVQRLLLDYRNREWGRWHPSAEARKLGKVAIEVENLVVRDQRSVDEALLALKSRHPDITREEIERLAASFPLRHRRRLVDLEEAEDVLQVAPRDFAPERRRTAERVSTVVRDFLDNLSDEDRLTFQLRFLSDMTIVQIARMTNRDQKLLYRRLDRLTADLRKALTANGIEATDVLELLRKNPELLDFQWKSTDPE